MDDDGRLNEAAGDFAGMSGLDARRAVWAALEVPPLPPPKGRPARSARSACVRAEKATRGVEESRTLKVLLLCSSVEQLPAPYSRRQSRQQEMPPGCTAVGRGARCRGTPPQAEGLAIKTDPHINRVPRSQRGGEVIEPLVRHPAARVPRSCARGRLVLQLQTCWRLRPLA